MKGATISDVAALAGVSKSTVSAVLNNRSGVRESTRRTILRAMHDLSYRPSHSARRGFRPARGRTITFVVKEAANPYYAEILAGIQEVTAARGYLVAVSSSEGAYDLERRIVEQAIEQETDGLIITPILNDDTDLLHIFELRRNNVPFVLLEAVLGVRANLVDVDNVEASREAVRHLIDSGHSRIIHFAGPKYSAHSEERAEGVRRAFSESRLVFDGSMLVHAGDTAEDGYRAGLEHFRGCADARPTAVTCYNDLVALGLLRALRELGLDVPGQVSVIGFDDLRMLDYFPLPLTTVHIPKYEMGRRAAEILMRQLEGGPGAAPEKVSLQARLVVRESTLPLARPSVAANAAVRGIE